MNHGRVICAFLGQNSAAAGHPGAQGALNSAVLLTSRQNIGVGRSVFPVIGLRLVSEVRKSSPRRRPPRIDSRRSTPWHSAVVLASAEPRFSVNSTA